MKSSRAIEVAAISWSLPGLAVGAMLFLASEAHSLAAGPRAAPEVPATSQPAQPVPQPVPATSQLPEVPAVSQLPREVPAVSQPAAAPDLRTELARILAEQAADWSRGDVEAFASIYADDATFVAPTGMTRGRAALVERYRRRYPDRAAMGTLALELLEIRPGGESVVSVVARWTLTYPDKPAVSGLTLLVFHRLPAGWRIVQDASM